MFGFRRIWSFIILLITVAVVAYVVVVVIPSTLARRSYEGARAIGNDIREALQFTPEITVNNTVVVQQQTPVLELASLTQTFSHRYTWENRWMKSTKKIFITGTFEARAGFDLSERLSIRIHNDMAIVTLPEPRLLSLDIKDDITFRDENGIWNWVNPDDRAQAVNAFIRDARAFAREGNFIADAKKPVEQQLRDILKPHVKEVVIGYSIPVGNSR